MGNYTQRQTINIRNWERSGKKTENPSKEDIERGEKRRKWELDRLEREIDAQLREVWDCE